MKINKGLILFLLLMMVIPNGWASLLCKLSKNLDNTTDGALLIEAITTTFGDILDNQIFLGTTITTQSGTFDLDLLKLYYFHEKINCPQYTLANCKINSELNTLEITGDDFPMAKVEISLDLGESVVQEILQNLFPQSSNCPIKSI